MSTYFWQYRNKVVLLTKISLRMMQQAKHLIKNESCTGGTN